MRIIAGAFKGSKLVAPGGSNTRPTSDRVKESLFSMLDGYGVLQAANVLDLFAGSGGLGLEAMSRGAAEVDFVDSASVSVRAVESNARKLGIDHSTRVHSSDVVSFLSSQRDRRQGASPQRQPEGPGGGADGAERAEYAGGLAEVQDGQVLESRSDLDDGEGRIFDLVFMDPPYPLGEDAVTQILGRLSGLLDMESIVVVERASRAPEPTMPAALEVFRAKTFGETALYFVQLKANPVQASDDAAHGGAGEAGTAGVDERA
ncbi:MAG: RsmD family RNA methyltransferase [Brevibacterium sp.]|nr:RsmD family RNA methyltransferase [Brevibacterium sp.]MDN5834734.1 RsmD family RNA methyltransferase [Brevibacterium sp.]MDN5910167.1 RsmD family RNA methyltransferase [Brevibacterium sp.]MDN6135024.1 RsmD family RNA methyltransferase [Brevibacterium sp.]MDN6158548.1 RsmD family RNA methyltransferase [Brevibacterium sp.]